MFNEVLMRFLDLNVSNTTFSLSKNIQTEDR